MYLYPILRRAEDLLLTDALLASAEPARTEVPVGVHHAPEFAAALHVVTEYLSLSLGSPPKDFTPDTPFMDAGLDSLDLLKVLRASIWSLQGSSMLSLYSNARLCIRSGAVTSAMKVYITILVVSGQFAQMQPDSCKLMRSFCMRSWPVC